MNSLFIACNHGMQVVLHAMSVIETPYCTQQTGRLTQGMPLRAIHAADADSMSATGCNTPATFTPRHCVQYRYRAVLRRWAFRPWSDGADGRVPRRAQRRVILVFWPILAWSPNQTSMSPPSRPRSAAIAAKVAGQFPEKLPWHRSLLQHVAERLRTSLKVGQNAGAVSFLVV